MLFEGLKTFRPEIVLYLVDLVFPYAFFVSPLDMPLAMLAAVGFAVVFAHDFLLCQKVVSCFVFLSR